MDINTEKPKPIEQVLESIKDLTDQITNDFSDIKEDIAFIKEKLKEKEYTMDQAEKDKYTILDNNREENPKGWFW
jgi:hypothetical protein